MADDRPPPAEYDAIVLAGGRSSRLGTDKTRLEIDGVPVLDRVLTAVGDAGRRIVVGEPRPVPIEVVWAREDPVGGGPTAGVVAGLAYAAAPIAVLLAADLPRLDAATVRRLLDAYTGAGAGEGGGAGAGEGGAAGEPYDGAILVDPTGRRQHLTCAVATESLRRAARTRSSWHDAAMHELLAPLRLRPIAVHGHEADDIDTPEDLSAPYDARASHRADNSQKEETS